MVVPLAFPPVLVKKLGHGGGEKVREPTLLQNPLLGRKVPTKKNCPIIGHTPGQSTHSGSPQNEEEMGRSQKAQMVCYTEQGGTKGAMGTTKISVPTN